MAEIIKIKKGLDIPLNGAASAKHTADNDTYLFGLIPDDFPGHKWKCAVKAGDRVYAGSPLLYSKDREKVKLVSPVCGIVEEVRRGERRKIEVVTVQASVAGGKPTAEDYLDFAQGTDPAGDHTMPSEREKILETLCESGMFALMRQRPFDIVPDPEVTPRDIFVTAFDSAPLAGRS